MRTSHVLTKMVTLTFNNVRGIIMRKKSEQQETVKVEQQKVDPMIELLKELIKVNLEIKEILLQLKNRFI